MNTSTNIPPSRVFALRAVRWLCVTAILITAAGYFTQIMVEDIRAQVRAIESHDKLTIQRYKTLHPTVELPRESPSPVPKILKPDFLDNYTPNLGPIDRF